MDLKPGPELDALLAEKVMGWVLADVGPYKDSGWNYPDGTWTEYWTTEKASRECPGFSPSEDIACAWEVVEKLISQDHYVSVFSSEWSGPDRPKAPGWACQVSSDDTSLADSAPHAICLAALKTVTSDIPK